MMNRRWVRWVWLAFRVLFVAAIFFFIFSRLDANLLWEQVRTVDWRFVSLAALVVLVALFAASLRWKILLDHARPGIPLVSVFAFTLIGAFYAQFLPGVVTADFVKGYYLARNQNEKVAMVASALTDRVLGVVVNGLLGVSALAVSPLLVTALDLNASTPLVMIAVVVLGLGAGYAGFRWIGRFEGRFPGPLKAAYEAVGRYVDRPRVLGLAALVSVAYFLIWTLSLWLLAFAIGIGDLGYFMMLLVLAAINLAQFLPISINGLGVRESVVVLLLGASNVPAETALLLSLLFVMVNLVVTSLGGLLVLADYQHVKMDVAS